MNNNITLPKAQEQEQEKLLNESLNIKDIVKTETSGLREFQLIVSSFLGIGYLVTFFLAAFLREEKERNILSVVAYASSFLMSAILYDFNPRPFYSDEVKAKVVRLKMLFLVLTTIVVLFVCYHEHTPQLAFSIVPFWILFVVKK